MSKHDKIDNIETDDEVFWTSTNSLKCVGDFRILFMIDFEKVQKNNQNVQKQ